MVGFEFLSDTDLHIVYITEMDANIVIRSALDKEIDVFVVNINISRYTYMGM